MPGRGGWQGDCLGYFQGCVWLALCPDFLHQPKNSVDAKDTTMSLRPQIIVASLSFVLHRKSCHGCSASFLLLRRAIVQERAVCLFVCVFVLATWVRRKSPKSVQVSSKG